MENIQVHLQNWDDTITVALIWDVINGDPGRYSVNYENGSYYVTANSSDHHRHPAANNVCRVDLEMNLRQ